ncbi:MAG: hypothetical protein KKD44_21800 [Proteobacteria bacterium]|nr:hypothetical protein [Pseudomonadota bacterium]
MKKFLLGLTVLLTVVAASSQAFAYFEAGQLILSVYNETDMDLGVDLGNAMALSQTTDTNVVLATAGTISLDKFGDNVDSWSDLSAGAYGGIQNLYQIYEGMTDTVAPPVPVSQISNFMNGVLMTSSEYGRRNNGEQYAVMNSSNSNSYDIRLNSNSNAPGTFGGINIDGSTNKSEANLGLLDTVGYVDLYLYAFDAMADMAGLSGGAEPNAVIRIMADGSVVLNATDAPEVPIPGSLILLSSGLLGMIGIRRKNA